MVQQQNNGFRFPGAFFFLAAAVIAAIGLLSGPVKADAATAAVRGTVITIISSPGDRIGEGIFLEYDTAKTSIKGTAASNVIELSVGEDPYTLLPWAFVIAPPRGSTFHVGYFPDVQRPGDRAKGRPGLFVGSGPFGTGCIVTTGSFEVRDLALSGTKITRLDVLYTEYCDASSGGLFGEIRINEPEPPGVLVSSSSITWPPRWEGDLGPLWVPVVIENRGSKGVPVAGVSLSGYAARDFRLRGHGCSVQVLAAGRSCVLWVNITPSTPGPRSAMLTMKLGTAWDRVQLDAPVPMGTTSLTMSYQPKGGQPQTFSYSTANAGFNFQPWPKNTAGVQTSIDVGGTMAMTASLAAAAGHALPPGNYPIVSNTGQGNHFLIADFPSNAGCNAASGSFQVRQGSYADKLPVHFDATFAVQDGDGRCTGELKYQSAPVITAPPRVAGLSAARSGGRLRLAWKNPDVSRYRYTVVRVGPAGMVSAWASAGRAAYAGPGQQAAISGLTPGQSYLLAVFTVDQYGNVSAPAELRVTG